MFQRQQKAGAGLSDKFQFLRKATPSKLGKVSDFSLLHRNQYRESSKNEETGKEGGKTMQWQDGKRKAMCDRTDQGPRVKMDRFSHSVSIY